MRSNVRLVCETNLCAGSFLVRVMRSPVALPTCLSGQCLELVDRAGDLLIGVIAVAVAVRSLSRLLASSSRSCAHACRSLACVRVFDINERVVEMKAKLIKMIIIVQRALACFITLSPVISYDGQVSESAREFICVSMCM